MRLTLVIHRQDGPDAPPRVGEHEIDGLRPHMSLLDVLDLLNARLLESCGDPVSVESDCLEGICGACGVTVDGRPHGPRANTPTCHQRLASFADGQRVVLEPLRAAAYPVLRVRVGLPERLGAPVQRVQAGPPVPAVPRPHGSAASGRARRSRRRLRLRASHCTGSDRTLVQERCVTSVVRTTDVAHRFRTSVPRAQSPASGSDCWS